MCQLLFDKPSRTHVSIVEDGRVLNQKDPTLVAPARCNVAYDTDYCLKLTNIEGRPGARLYPVLSIEALGKDSQVLQTMPITLSLPNPALDLAFNGKEYVQVFFIPDNIDRIETPNRYWFDGAIAVISNRLRPSPQDLESPFWDPNKISHIDPRKEAKRMGTVVAVLRVGGIDLESGLAAATEKPEWIIESEQVPFHGGGTSVPSKSEWRQVVCEHARTMVKYEIEQAADETVASKATERLQKMLDRINDNPDLTPAVRSELRRTILDAIKNVPVGQKLWQSKIDDFL